MDKRTSLFGALPKVRRVGAPLACFLLILARVWFLPGILPFLPQAAVARHRRSSAARPKYSLRR